MLAAYSADAVRAAEEPLLAAGPPGALMAQASFALATHVVQALHARGRPVVGSRVLALVGGGNNGGDALHAATFLARRGALVSAALLAPEPHAEALAAARAAGVRLVAVPDPALEPDSLETPAAEAEVWVDGLAGIGVRGALRGRLAAAVRLLDALRERLAVAPLVVAVDTPSGIGVDDGTTPGPVLPAHLTVTMGVPKPGLLLPPAAALAGEVHCVDIGLGPDLRARRPAVLSLAGADVADLWPVPERDAHKYTRGVLGLVAGSARYPGAGALAAAGACGAGVGMVRYLGSEAVLRLVHVDHPEVVGAGGRVQAWALGSGAGPGADRAPGRLAGHLRAALGDGLPAVLDAGALALLDPRRRGGVREVPSSVVLTPHAGELATLLAARGIPSPSGGPVDRAAIEASPARWARVAAVATGATVLLKGPVTVVAPPDGPLLAQGDGTPWLATAGAGDVLAGVLGALLAGRSDDVRADPALAARLAAAAALVHGRAARRVGGPLTAGDVARAVSGVVAGLLATGDAV